MRRALLALAFVLVPSLAFAHVGVGDPHGIGHGFLHPLTGIDHILAMVGVGIFAAHLGGRAIWLVPLSFMGMMAVGGAIGIFGLPVPFVEMGIGLSIVAFGLLIAFEVTLPIYAAMAVVGLFAVFHGHAHGVEMPKTASGLAYGLGFVAATGLLHLAGVGVGLGIGSSASGRPTKTPKIVGGAMAVCGAGLLAGAL